MTTADIERDAVDAGLVETLAVTAGVPAGVPCGDEVATAEDDGSGSGLVPIVGESETETDIDGVPVTAEDSDGMAETVLDCVAAMVGVVDVDGATEPVDV